LLPKSKKIMKNDFNSKYCERTKIFAIQLCKHFNVYQNRESARVVIRQILRCGTSVSANFRAATRARSKAEYFSKICIVVEECDETVFWFEIMNEAGLVPKELILSLHKESIELLKIFSATKKKLKANK
jgi:four helix bundle protein